MAEITPTATGNPLLDDAGSSGQGYQHPTDGNPLLTDRGAGGGTLTGTNDDTGPTGLMSRSWMSLKDVGSEPPPPSQTPVRDLARNAAAAVGRGTVNSLDVITNPSQAVFRPLMTYGGAAYDAVAPSLGLPRMTPEQRADITGTGDDPAERGDIAQAVSAFPKSINPYAVRPRTPLEAQVATALEGATTGAQLGSFGPLGAMTGGLLGGLGASAGGNVASYAPDWAKPSVEMATNMLIQGAGGYARTPPGTGIDPAVANLVQRGMNEPYNIPFRAPDFTEGSSYRTGPQIQRTSDAMQGYLTRELGLDPNTGDPVTTNRITPDTLTTARTNAVNDMNAITGSNDMTVMHTNAVRNQLNQLENRLPTIAGLDAGERAQIQQQITEVRNSVDPRSNTISGNDYQSLTQHGSNLDSLTNSGNPTVAATARTIDTALSNGFRNSLSADDNAAFTNARYRYRLQSTLEPLVSRAGGQSLNMGDLANRIYDQSQEFDTGTGRMGYTGGGGLGDVMRMSDLIQRGPRPSNVSPLGGLTTPTGIAAMTLSPDPGTVALANTAPWLAQKIIGPFARSQARTGDVIAGATTNRPNAAALSPYNARVQQAIAALTAAGTQ